MAGYSVEFQVFMGWEFAFTGVRKYEIKVTSWHRRDIFLPSTVCFLHSEKKEREGWRRIFTYR